VCTNQDGQTVIRGTAEVLAPTEKIKRPRVELPEVTLVDREARYQHLLERTRGLAPIPMAVAHPCDKESLLGVVEAHPGRPDRADPDRPARKIRAVAEQQGIDLPAANWSTSSTATPPPRSPWRWRAKAPSRR
jgi:phosphate acetyltransferase